MAVADTAIVERASRIGDPPQSAFLDKAQVLVDEVVDRVAIGEAVEVAEVGGLAGIITFQAFAFDLEPGGSLSRSRSRGTRRGKLLRRFEEA